MKHLLLFITAFCAIAPPIHADEIKLKFRDVAKETGLLPAAENIHGHGAGWGDVNGDSFPDLYIGTFHKPGTTANLLFLNQSGKKFTSVTSGMVNISTRATGVIFADLDNDGDLDLYIGSMPKEKTTKSPNEMRGCSLFENRGGNPPEYVDRSDDNGACPARFGGRSVAVLDYNGDGLLDLLVGEDPNSGYNGSPTSSSRLFENKGDLKFEDVTSQAGIPADIPGLGVAATDVNGDSLPDFFIASAGGGNVLFINQGDGTFREPPGARELFDWKGAGGDNMVCGICFGDLNRDGKPDVVLGPHFDHPWREPVPNRVFLNEGPDNKTGYPKFREVTTESASPNIPIKSPHVEIQDFDNDGWPDISTSVVMFSKDGKPHPVILRNTGTKLGGIPKFSTPALDVNDFPTGIDQSIGSSGKFFKKMLAERKVTYAAPGPVSDFDRDGRLDILIPSWWKETDLMLLKNESNLNESHWIRIGLNLIGANLNRSGIGTRIEVYPKGEIGKPQSLIGVKEIATGFGYASGQSPLAHFGLGNEVSVDLRITLPHKQGTIDYKNQPVDRELILKYSAENR